jgi:hypothetical protein
MSLLALTPFYSNYIKRREEIIQELVILKNKKRHERRQA